jgi:hypothetical protein
VGGFDGNIYIVHGFCRFIGGEVKYDSLTEIVSGF